MNRILIRTVLLGIVLLLAGCQTVNSGWIATIFPERNIYSRNTDSAQLPRLHEQLEFDQSSLVGRIGPASVGISPSNTIIEFVGSSGPMTQMGSFQDFSGNLQMPKSNLRDAQFEIQISMDSVKTGNWLLSKHLMSKDFFEVKKYPTADFSSDSIVATEKPGEYVANGQLTFHGVTKFVQVPTFIESDEGKLNLRMEFLVAQSEFGMSRASKITKDEVPVVLNARIDQLNRLSDLGGKISVRSNR